jgi:MFS family permease
VETAAARFLLIVFSGAGTIGLLAGGRLADVFGRRPTTISALLIGLVGGVGFYAFDNGWILAATIFLATFGATMITPSLGAHRAELFPTRVRATAGGWVTNTAILGSIFGFVVGGILIDRIGLSVTILILGAGLLISVMLVLTLPETRGMDLVRRRAVRSGTTTTAQQPAPASAPSSPTTPQQDPAQEPGQHPSPPEP